MKCLYCHRNSCDTTLWSNNLRLNLTVRCEILTFRTHFILVSLKKKNRNVGLLSVNGPPYNDYNHRGGNLQDMNKPCELLTAQQVCQRYPGFAFQPEVKAFVDPSGGVLYADRCLKALQVRRHNINSQQTDLTGFSFRGIRKLTIYSYKV